MLNGGLPAAAASSQAVGSAGSGSGANWNLVVKLENSERTTTTTMTQSNVTSAASGEGATVSSAAAAATGGAVQQSSAPLNNSGAQQQPGVTKRKRNLPGMPDPDAEVIALSPKTLMATNRFVCEICNKGFQRDQNLQLHRRGHNLPWKLRQRTSKEIRKRVYICPEPSCVHHDPSRALGDLTGIKKHFCRKHGEKKWKCDKCSKRYAVQSDWKAHSKTCGTREYRCDCGTLFSRRDSFITHRAFCDALAEESARATVNNTEPVATRTTTNSSSDDCPNPGAGGCGTRPCPSDSHKVSISSTGGAVAPPPPPARWGAQTTGGSGGGGGGSGPRLSLWLGPGPGGPGPPPTLESASGSSSSQFNAMDGTGTYPYPFFIRAANNPNDRSAAAAAAAAAELCRPGGGGGGGGGFMAPASASASSLFASLLTSGSLQAAQNPTGFSELIGAMTRGGNGSTSTSTSSVTTAAPAIFSTGIPAIFSHHPQPLPVQQQQHNNTAAAQMSATALLQKAAQMGANVASNSSSLHRGFVGLAGHDNSWPPMMAATNHSSVPYPLLRRFPEGVMPMPMPMSMPTSSSIDQVTMHELMNSLSSTAGLGNLTGLLLQSPLLAPHMSNGNGSTVEQTGACGNIKAEELGTSMKPTTLDFLGLGGSHGRTLSHTDYAMITSMSTTQATKKMISKGKSYVDDTPREQMQKERMDGIESVNRNNTMETNMALWKEMVAGTERGKQCCLRGKMDMQAANKSLRDPVYYRCNPISHHRVGSKYKVYPTYDFACPYVDSIEGVTHALRSSEYHDRNEQYYWVLKDMGVRKVHVWDFSRLNFVYTLLSKRKLQWFVDNGKVEGWDDPLFPTVQGIIRRGLTVEALKQFILSQGASKNLNLMEWDKLWTMNKKIIDPVCPRHTAVLQEGRVLLCLTNGPEEPFVRIAPQHKKYEGAGKKATTYTKEIWLDGADAAAVSEGEEVTLMDWGNAIIKQVEKDKNGTIIHLSGVLHLEGSVKTTKLKLTWLPEISELVNLSLVELDHLITKKKLEETDDFLKVLNPCTRWGCLAIGDANMRNLKRGETLQLERKGYFRCDVPYLRPSKPIVLIAIPDGRQQSVLRRPSS